MAESGRVAYIDLTTGTSRQEPIPEQMRRLYLGGRGLDMYLLYNCIEPGLDPLSPGSVLLVSGGLLSGTPAPGSGRGHMGGKSPLTGLIGSSNVGGFFAPELRFAGLDHLVIQGKAAEPTYLWINNGRIEFRDASHLWGLDAIETQKRLKGELGPEVQIACIGQAGENLVKYACVRHGYKSSAGRTGMGAVMGSKNLKAIAVRGSRGIEVKHPAQALDYYRELNSKITRTKAAAAMSRLGTLMIYSATNALGALRTRNHQLNQFIGGEGMDAENMDRYSLGMSACLGCAVHCRHRYRVPEGPDAGSCAEGPEHAGQGSLGSICGVGRIEDLMVSNHLCNKYGLDLMHSGNMIGWAMELYEKGIIDRRTTGGLALEWGDNDVILELLRQIVYREGFGEVLADGFEPAIRQIGEESRYYAMHVKGMCLSADDDRPLPSFGFGLATSTRGADHLRSRPGIDMQHLPQEVLLKVYGFPVSSDFTSYEGKAKMVWYHELLYAIVDSLGVCKFQTAFLSPSNPRFEEYSRMLNYITGMDIPASELMEIGERVYTLERMFNNREGASRKDDYLPKRLYSEPTPLGTALTRGRRLDRELHDQMLDEYYEQHGWDREGVPIPETLSRLGLDREPSHML
ncbi:MAG: aldehyde ferredoxin oxidoreductase family protein [Dehalococcoidia bacterium]